MESDAVKILTITEEENGVQRSTVELSKQPQYMLKEEYNGHLISCAVNAVKETIKAIYPDNEKAQENCARGILVRALSK